MTDYRLEAPPILRDFLTYHETIQGHSKKTVDEYFLDLRTFFRYIKIEKGRVPRTTPLDEISIGDVDLALVKSVTLTDIYAFLSFLSRDRVKNANDPNSRHGLEVSSRARKVATIRSFYKYLVSKAKLLDENPIQELDSPKIRQTLPRYLTLDESIQLLESIDGENAERDFCIITLFLNCGLRISELVGLNLSDIRGDRIRVLGKGNKERIIYLNAACQSAIEDWLEVRSHSGRPLRPVHLPQTHPAHKGWGPLYAQTAVHRRRAGQQQILRPQAAPHRRHPDAAKRRGCAHPPGGAGP